MRAKLRANGLALCIAIIASAASAADTQPAAGSLRKEVAGLRYAAARDKLIARGWTPTPASEGDPSGAASYFWKLGFTEVESCSEGEVVCSFLFKRADGSCLHVVTAGSGGGAKVEHLDHRCFTD
jgi:hypothetical protein